MKRLSFIALLFVSIILSGCNQQVVSEKVLTYQENREIIGDEKEKKIGTVSQSIYETSDRSNTNAFTVDIPLERKKGGEVSLPSGRYVIEGNPTGNIYVYDEKGELLYREILGFVGVPSITLDINETHRIVADGGFDSVLVSPTSTQLLTSLSAGVWDVGLDIEPGIYSVSAGYGMGYLHIFEKNEEPQLFELISSQWASTEAMVELKKGQKLKITGTGMLNFNDK